MDTKRKSKKKRLIFLGSVLIILLLAAFLVPRIWLYSQFNKEGNILLLNRDENKIYEMTEDGLIVWSYDSFIYEYDKVLYLLRLSNGNTVISDGQAGRIYEINRSGGVIWSCNSIYGKGDTTYRAGFETCAMEIANENILAIGNVSESGEVFEFDRDCNIIWEWTYDKGDPDYWEEHVTEAHYLANGNTGVLLWKIYSLGEWWQESRTSTEVKEYIKGYEEKYPFITCVEYLELDSNRSIVKRRAFDRLPYSTTGAQVLSNGHVLISYEEYGVAEYDTSGKIIWSYQPPETLKVREGQKSKILAGAEGAFRCSNGNTVIYYPMSWVYVVDSHKNVISHFKSPAIKSKFGIKYVTEEDEDKPEDEIDYLDEVLGVVNK